MPRLLSRAMIWLLNAVALIPFRRAKDAHCTKRARALYQARVGVQQKGPGLSTRPW